VGAKVTFASLARITVLFALARAQPIRRSVHNSDQRSNKSENHKYFLHG